MGYIDKNLLPGEEILFRTKKHIIIFFYPLIVLVVAIYASQQMSANAYVSQLLSQFAWVIPLIAILYAIPTAVEYTTSEFIVTNKRVLMREGFFTRHATELRLNTISQVNIDQNLVGQLLDFGTVSLNAFGVFDRYATIAKPYAFRRCINEQMDQGSK